MTKEEVAKALNGKEYLEELSPEFLKDWIYGTDLVIVLGRSDDIMSFEGAINDEVDCWEGGTAWINPAKRELLRNLCDDDYCPYYQMQKEG